MTLSLCIYSAIRERPRNVTHMWEIFLQNLLSCKRKISRWVRRKEGTIVEKDGIKNNNNASLQVQEIPKIKI